eukprot:gene18015-39578_t
MPLREPPVARRKPRRASSAGALQGQQEELRKPAQECGTSGFMFATFPVPCAWAAGTLLIALSCSSLVAGTTMVV